MRCVRIVEVEWVHVLSYLQRVFRFGTTAGFLLKKFPILGRVISLSVCDFSRPAQVAVFFPQNLLALRRHLFNYFFLTCGAGDRNKSKKIHILLNLVVTFWRAAARG